MTKPIPLMEALPFIWNTITDRANLCIDSINENFLYPILDWSIDALLDVAFLDEAYHYTVLGVLIGIVLSVTVYMYQLAQPPSHLVDAAYIHIKSMLFKSEQNFKVLQREIEDYKNQKQRLERELSESLSRTSALKCSLTELSSSPALTDHEGRTIPSLQASVLEWRTKACRLESLLSGLEERTEADHTRIQEEMLQRDAAMQEREQRVAHSKSLLEECTGKLAAANSKIYLLEAARIVYTNKALAADSSGESQDGLNGLRSSNQALMKEITQLKAEIQDERAARMSCELDIVTMKNTINRMRGQVLSASNAQSECVTLATRCEDLERQVKAKGRRKADGTGDAEGSELDAASGYLGFSAGATSVLDGTIGFLSAPIVPMTNLLGITQSTEKTPAPQTTDGISSPGGTVSSPTRASKSDVSRTHEKLRQKALMAAALSPGKTKDPSAAQSGVLGAAMINLAQRLDTAGNVGGSRTPVKL